MKMATFFSTMLIFVVSSLGSTAYSKSLSPYSITQYPQGAGANANAVHPPLDITIVNASSSYIYAVVPNTPINTYIDPGYNAHITNFDAIPYTYVVLQDAYRNTFYATNACMLAIITVSGYIGNYRTNYDDELCH